MGEHHCHARGCSASIPPKLLMCGRHWGMVPAKLQVAVYRHYRDGQCDDKNPSEAWHKAADAAIDAVFAKEHPPAAESDLVASHRKTSNSRGPGQEGVVYHVRNPLVDCGDCGKKTSHLVPEGRHGAHFILSKRGEWVAVNCANVPIPWPRIPAVAR